MRCIGRGALGLGLVVLACGSERESEDAYYGTSGYVRDCGFATESLGESEVTSLGVSPSDVATWLEGEHRVRIEYSPEFRESLEPEPAASELSIEIESRGRAGWVNAVIENPRGREVYCRENLVVGAHVRLSTADGIVSHEMDLSFVLDEPELAVATVLISTEAIRTGSREPSPVPAGESPDVWLALNLEVRPSGTAGTINYHTSDARLNSAVAAFPGRMVCTRGYAPMLGAEYASFREQAVAALNASSPVPLSSRGASLELRFDDRGESGCVLARSAGNTTLEFAADAVLRSSDGSIDGEMEVLLDADFGGPDLFAARATRSIVLFDAEEAATQTAGVITEPLDFSPYANQGFEFIHRVTGAGSIEGVLRAYGVAAAECDVVSPSELCSQDVDLFAARWGDIGTARQP